MEHQCLFRWPDGLPHLTGQVKESPRTNFFYISNDGGVMAVRAGDYKLIFQEQLAENLRVWQQPFVQLRLPDIIHLRRDPFERALDNSNTLHSYIWCKPSWRSRSTTT